MQVVSITGEKQCELIEKPDPQAKGEFALIRIIAAPMCTEYKFYKSGRIMDGLGHESAGEVAEAGENAGVKPGDRVMVMPLYPCGTCELCREGDYIGVSMMRN